jgi:hypothetical protein
MPPFGKRVGGVTDTRSSNRAGVVFLESSIAGVKQGVKWLKNGIFRKMALDTSAWY